MFFNKTQNFKRLYFSDSPTYLEIRSEEEIEKKVPSVSVAQALARKVFPVPGGYRSFRIF